ncbi:phosphotransferase family protein [Rhabdothermincola salaria]|uniref:phosphotransferase family protein n=1 Tax=Rhabdothermincola salaria TaxID=2903142 RepID=UPI001E4EA450|nr:phosphotransferase family protein [Rhabdothermincola salaria]
MAEVDDLTLADPERLAPWLDQAGVAPGNALAVEPLVGGASNAMFLVHRGGHTYVLRRPAQVAVDRADEGMRREFRFLSALAGTDVPHPEAVAFCDDNEVLGCAFYLMARVEGFNPMPASLPPAFDDPAGRRAITEAMVDALAALHDVDWRAAGLGDLDRTAGFHDRQVSRWVGQLESYEGRDMPGTDEIGRWLDGHRPTSFVPTIMHGDYHMMNVLVGPDRPARVSAILDWETSTIGDPLLDLAGYCEIWAPMTDPADGWPDRAEIVERYAARRGIEVPPLRYHQVLYNFRMTVLLEGIYQRSLKDPTRPAMDMVGDQALRFLRRATELVTG